MQEREEQVCAYFVVLPHDSACTNIILLVECKASWGRAVSAEDNVKHSVIHGVSSLYDKHNG